MGFNIIYGRSGSGKTSFCLDDIKTEIQNNTNTSIILVVPEQFSFQAEKELVKSSKTGGVLKNEVLSFGRLSYRIFNKEGGITYPHIHTAGKAMIIHKIIENNSDKFKAFERVCNKQGFVDTIKELITEFKRYNVTPEDLHNVMQKLDDNETLRQKLSEICMIYQEFETSILEKYTDPNDELTMATKKLKDSTMLSDTKIWIDGFSGYTRQEYDMIEALFLAAKSVTITFCMDKLIAFDENVDPVDVFASVKRAYKNIMDIARRNNVKVAEVIHLEHTPKFSQSREIAHLEQNYSSYPYRIYKDKTCDISVNAYMNMFDEVQDVAKKVMHLCQKEDYRYKDIAIVSRDIKLYQKILEVVLKEYNIPYFVDKKVEMSNNNLSRFIVSMLEIFTENWSYEAVFRTLRTGFLDIAQDRIDRLENYVLACGIKGRKWTVKDKWDMIPEFLPSLKAQQKSIELLEEINDTRDKIVTPLLNFRNKNNEKKTTREFCKDLYNLLCELAVPEKLTNIANRFNEQGKLDKGSEYGQVWNVLMDFLDQMVEVQGQEKMTIRKFLKLFKTGIKEYSLGVIPMGQDQVLVGSVERSKSHNIKAMYILGVNDGIFPAKGANEGILSDDDRHVLQDNNIVIAQDTKLKAFDEQFLIYQTLTVPTKILHVSYAMQDLGGKTLRPSIIISRLKRIFPNIKTITNIGDNKDLSPNSLVSKPQIFSGLVTNLKNKLYKKDYDKEWDGVYKWFSNNDNWKPKCDNIKKAFSYRNSDCNISKKKVHELYGESIIESVSRLEKFTACPFGFYVEYGLGVKERKIYKLTPPDIGTFLHTVIDTFSKEVSSGENTWRTFDEEWCKDKVSQIVDQMLEKMQGLVVVSSKRYMTLINRLKKVITKMLILIAEQIRNSSFNPVGYEVGFGDNDTYPPIEITLDTGEKIRLTGRIDRVDKFEQGDNVYIRIVDYKSGNKRFELEDLFYGLQIQLATYLDAIWGINDKVKPAGMMYLRLDNPMLKEDTNLTDEDIQKEIVTKLRMNGLVLKDKDVIRSMDNSIDGQSLYIPAYIKRDGEIGSSTKGANYKQFDILRQYTKKLLKGMCEEIVNGKVKINPYRQKGKTACDFCKFLPICQFDKEQNEFRVLKPKSEMEIWQDMEENVTSD